MLKTALSFINVKITSSRGEVLTVWWINLFLVCTDAACGG